MAGSLFDALKGAGFLTEDATKEERFSRENLAPLPFKNPWKVFGGYDELAQNEFEDLNFIRDNWFMITDEELNSYECEEGQNIYELLKRNASKIRVIEKRPENYGFCCMHLYFTYSPLIKRFSFELDSVFGMDKVCAENNLQLPSYSHLSFDKRAEAIAFFLANNLDTILLYISKESSILSYPSRSFTFERIKQDERAMLRLGDYLAGLEHQPNPKAKYFICKDEDMFGFRPRYYLKRDRGDENGTKS